MTLSKLMILVAVSSFWSFTAYADYSSAEKTVKMIDLAGHTFEITKPLEIASSNHVSFNNSKFDRPEESICRLGLKDKLVGIIQPRTFETGEHELFFADQLGTKRGRDHNAADVMYVWVRLNVVDDPSIAYLECGNIEQFDSYYYKAPIDYAWPDIDDLDSRSEGAIRVVLPEPVDL